MKELKLIALDAEDLAVLSAHLQDAVLRVGDMTYLKAERRFAALANRFDWEGAVSSPVSSKQKFIRRRAGLRFERVLGAKVTGIELAKKDTVLSLLAVRFEPGDAPGGHVVLEFSGGAAIRLHVECIEAELKDLGAAWATRTKPDHADELTGKND
jgi:hypothetical protein